MRTVFSLAICLALTVSVNAQETAKKETKKDGVCPISAAMKGLPTLEFKVAGKKVDGCIKCAQAESEKTEQPIVFLVGTKEFKESSKAKLELVKLTEKAVKDFATPKTCEVSKTITIAGKKCDCPIEAGKRAELVSTAMKNVKMSFKVGEETCDCPVKAKALVAKSGKAKEFVVGKECTTCEISARLALARAKYKAGLEALAKADALAKK